MSSITIKLKNGAILEFPHEGRSGGSYSKSVRYESGWAIVTDEWGKEHAFPAANIEEVIEKPNYSGGW